MHDNETFYHKNLIAFLFMDYRLVQFIDSYDPPLKGLQEDLNFVSPRIGEVIIIFNLPMLCQCIFLQLMTKRELHNL